MPLSHDDNVVRMVNLVCCHLTGGSTEVDMDFLDGLARNELPKKWNVERLSLLCVWHPVVRQLRLGQKSRLIWYSSVPRSGRCWCLSGRDAGLRPKVVH